MKQIQKRCGNIKDKAKLVAFLYILMRDTVTPGRIEEIMINHIKDTESEYSNGWLANYAKDIASRL